MEWVNDAGPAKIMVVVGVISKRPWLKFKEEKHQFCINFSRK
jgi:hypothetical protein